MHSHIVNANVRKINAHNNGLLSKVANLLGVDGEKNEFIYMRTLLPDCLCWYINSPKSDAQTGHLCRDITPDLRN